MNPKCIKAIVIDLVNGKAVGRGPYRNIKPAPGSIKGFKRNMKALFPNATHINFYDSKGRFWYQEKYESDKKEEKKRNRLIITYLDYAFITTGQPRKFNEILFSQWDL